jgi:hypothetical protein
MCRATAAPVAIPALVEGPVAYRSSGLSVTDVDILPRAPVVQRIAIRERFGYDLVRLATGRGRASRS